MTSSPDAGAGELKITNPVTNLPPTTVLGDTPTRVNSGGLIESPAVCVDPPRLAAIVVDITVETDFVLTVKDAVVDPPETKTLEGTVADELLEDSVTTAP